MLEELLQAGFAELGLAVDSDMLRRYRQYYEALEAGNQVMNLTAISGETDCARLHFLDCASLLTLAELDGRRLIDIGTGAGFPGLALKIACPGISLTLLDSLDKRVRFLSQTCEMLGFPDVDCLHVRAEEAPTELREAFDVATSRAVARLNLLCELSLPFVRPGGLFLAMKGPDVRAELDEAGRAISVLGGRCEGITPYTVPGTDIVHCVVRIRKEKPTPSKYPRRWAQIKKAPL